MGGQAEPNNKFVGLEGGERRRRLRFQYLLIFIYKYIINNENCLGRGNLYKKMDGPFGGAYTRSFSPEFII